MAARRAIAEQVEVLSRLGAEAVASERFDDADAIAATIAILNWVDTNAASIKAIHATLRDPAVMAMVETFGDDGIAISGIRRV